ncbi:MAG: CDP-alcohol phosphatidyltransferase family protein [Verrucomicrobiota bacterium]
MNTKLLPNLLSGARIALMPAVLLTALMGSKVWFVVLLTASLTTDMLDGFFARRFNAFTDFGRKLDSAADYLTMIVGITGIALLWPEIMRRELPWVATGLGAFFAVIVYGFVRLGRAPCYHTWLSKLGVLVCGFSMIPLLAEWTAVPFHVAMVMLIVAGVEEMTIALLIPAHSGEVSTVWHALRIRREMRGRER